MALKKDKNTANYFESWILDLPHLLGLPVPDNQQDDYSQCCIHFYISIIIFVVSTLILSTPGDFSQILKFIFSFNPNSTLLGKTVGSLTSNFVHGDFVHLFSNMYFFLIFAPLVEKRYGSINFLLIFCICALCSSIGTIFFMKTTHQISIGVSGTLMGLMGLTVAESPWLKFRLYKFFVIPCWLFIFSMHFIPDLISEYTARRTGISDHINHLAHILGFVSGYLLSFAIKPTSEKEKSAQLNSLRSVDISWLKSGTLWGEVIIGMLCPFLIFMINKSSLEKSLYGVANCCLYIFFHPAVAIIWAILYVFCDHKIRHSTHVSKHL